MARKLIIDTDSGIDDAVALTMALFDPRLEVLAVTATAGTVPAEQATDNIAAVVAALDPPRYPRIAKANSPSDDVVSDARFLNGPKGLGDFTAVASQRQHLPTSEKVIAELVRQDPGEVTLLCLGPLTNLSKLCRFDPGALQMIDKVVISGGTYQAPGNASAVSEFNLCYDPLAAHQVFQSKTTKSLVPLDITSQITFGVELLDQLPPRHNAVGNFLHSILPYSFRAHHQRLGCELMPLMDATAVACVLEPELFQWHEMAGKVETQGTLTRGMSVFDQRLRPEWQDNLEVALGGDIEEIKGLILRSLQFAGQQSNG
jgi:purine nucleosidase